MRKKIVATVFLVLIILFAFLGSQMQDPLHAKDKQGTRAENIEKFNEVLKYISSFYVDDVDWDKSMSAALEGMLSELDPHSVYIPANEVELNDENFQGKYEGIGIQFDVIDGYLTVIAPISGSPSDKIGLMAGDKIVKIDGVSAIGIQSGDVPKKLKGLKGTTVNISVVREGVHEPLEFTIVRDEIPIFTVNTAFMADEQTGYIFLNRFAKTTEAEIDQALQQLERDGCKRLILDLRWNAGGYLDQAVKLAARFISGHKKIVYTKSRLSSFDEDFYSDTFGVHHVFEGSLIVLINNASASASEIVAGAIQDYDRGLIMGTTSFGKGLVQREFPLKDDSRLRLTISKYYTPSGRLIQRPYKGKTIEDYYAEGMEDLDSLKVEEQIVPDVERPIFFTAGKRKVFGGGGITPDITLEFTANSQSPGLTQKFFQKRIFFEAASRFAVHHADLKNSPEKFLASFTVTEDLLNEFKAIATERGIVLNEIDFNRDLDFIKSRLKAEIARSLWDNDKYYRVILQSDNQFLEALKLFPEADKIVAGVTAKMKD